MLNIEYIKLLAKLHYAISSVKKLFRKKKVQLRSQGLNIKKMKNSGRACEYALP
jgi:hypothetical protein